MRVKWEVDDGYVGPSRPHYSAIFDEDIEDCEDVDEAMEMIWETILEDFQNTISFEYNEDKVRKEVEKIIKKE